MILTFYVPALWISLALIVGQLVLRRNEPLSEAPDGAHPLARRDA